MMTLPTEPRVSAISAIASRIDGMDISPSMIRMMIASAQRTKPENSPMARPIDRRAGRDREADDQRHARAVEHAGIDVAPEHVGAEPVQRRRLPRAPRRARARSGRVVKSSGAKTAIRTSMSSSSPPPIAMVGWRADVAEEAARAPDRRQDVRHAAARRRRRPRSACRTSAVDGAQ